MCSRCGSSSSFRATGEGVAGAECGRFADLDPADVVTVVPVRLCKLVCWFFDAILFLPLGLVIGVFDLHMDVIKHRY